MKHGLKDLEIKPIAKILPNGLIKYFDSFGNYIRIGFYFKEAEYILKNEGYIIIRE